MADDVEEVNIDWGAQSSPSSSKSDVEDLTGKIHFPDALSSSPQFVKDAVGGVESAVRMPWNFLAGSLAKGARAGVELAGGASLKDALSRGDESAEKVSINPLTQSGKDVDQAIGEGLQYGGKKLQDTSDYAFRKGFLKAQNLPDDYDPLSDPNKTRALKYFKGQGAQSAYFSALVNASAAVEGVRGVRDAKFGKPKESEPVEEVNIDWDKAQQPDLFDNTVNHPPMAQEIGPRRPSDVGPQMPENYHPEQQQGYQSKLFPSPQDPNIGPLGLVDPLDMDKTHQSEVPGMDRWQPEQVDINGERQSVQSPYNLSDDDRARIEKDIRKEQQGSQGDLFDNDKIYSSDEMQGKTFVLEDGKPREIKELPGENIHTNQYHQILSRMSEQFDMTPGNKEAGVRSEGTQQLKPVGEDLNPIDPNSQGPAETPTNRPLEQLRNVEDRMKESLPYEDLSKEVAAIQKPGFQRSAVEMLRARRLGAGPSKQRGHIGEWANRLKKDVKKSGSILTSMMDAKKQFESLGDRPLSKVIEDNGIGKSPLQDLGGEFSDKVATHGLIDRTIAILSQGKTGTGKILKWAIDSRYAIDRAKEVSIRDMAKTALDHWKSGKAEVRTDLRQMLDVWTKNIGGESLTRESFKNQRQWEQFTKTRDTLNNLIDKVNKTREKYGQKPITKIKNYLPAIWEGDYRIWVKDNAGVNKGVFSFKNSWQATRAREQIVKNHPDLVTEDVTHVKKSKYDLGDLSAFEEAMDVMSGDDKITAALQQTYAKIVTHRGFSKSGLERKGLFGYLGFEKGDLGVRNMERAIETYIKRAESHIANLDKANLKSQLAQLPIAMRKQIPNTIGYLNDYIDIAKGGRKDELSGITKTVGAITKQIGFGESAPLRWSQNVASFASLYWLITPKFFVSQFAQHLGIIPKMIQHVGPVKAIESYWRGMQNVISPMRDKEAQGFLDYSTKNGYMESALVSMMDMSIADARGRTFDAVGDFARGSLGKLEHYAVRMPAGLAMEYALRDTIKDPVARYKQAAEMMDYYMVHYDKASSPMVYNKAGLVGEQLRPLKQYSHNAWGQFFEYAQGLKDHHEVAPLAAFMGQQILVAGLKGTVLVAEATAIITTINALWNTDIPTPEKLMLKSKALPDWMIYGGFSTAIGADLSSSVAAPNIPQMFNLAPASFTTGIVAATFQYVRHMINGTLTDPIKMKFAEAVSPSAMKGWWEEYFTNESGITPNTAGAQGSYRRHGPSGNLNPQDKSFGVPLWLMSATSIDEAKANAMVRAAKNDLMQDTNQQIEAIDAIADRAQNHQPIDSALIQRYIQEGGNISNLSSDIVARIKKKMLTYPESLDLQSASGKMTNSKAHKLQVMRDYLDAKDVQEVPDNSPSGTVTPGKDKVSNAPVDNTVAGMELNRIQAKYNSPEEFQTRAKLRAADFNNDTSKIQSKIDAIDKSLQEGKLEGTQRGILVSEAQLLQKAKEYAKGQIKLESQGNTEKQPIGQWERNIIQRTYPYQAGSDGAGRGAKVFGNSEQMGNAPKGKEFETDAWKRRQQAKRKYSGIL